MFLFTGALLGIAGVVSFVLVALAAFGGTFEKYEGIEYWISVSGALIRNGLMAAAGYAAFKQPMAAPALAWAAFGIYVVLNVGRVWVISGSFQVRDLITTFYVTALLIATCAAVLTVFQP